MALADTRGSTFYLNGRLIRFNDLIGRQKDQILGKGLHIVVDVSDDGDTKNLLLTPLPHKQVRLPPHACLICFSTAVWCSPRAE
jgi:hypothetical protein